MPDEPAGQNAVTQAQELGADILAKLDALTRAPEAGSIAQTEDERERKKKLAQEAIDAMKVIVDSFTAREDAQNNEAAQQARATEKQEEIERLKASVGA